MDELLIKMKTTDKDQYLSENDVLEESVRRLSPNLLDILLFDHSTGKNILWACDDYQSYGDSFTAEKEILPSQITGEYTHIIQPRSAKAKDEQLRRTRGKGEVFTPSWICNAQNNLVDAVWFGTPGLFNAERGKTWVATTAKIPFPTLSGKTWKDYINDTRLEITCGEAPYLVSRYDSVSGELIELSRRMGLLDRKLRVVSENANSEPEWYVWAKKAVQSIYGFDWQGDNVLLARENIMFTFIDYYQDKFAVFPSVGRLKEIAEIVSWNVWQMDGLKFVIPNSCKKQKSAQISLLGESQEEVPCEGCANNNPLQHTGIYCMIKDWEENKTVKFVSLLNLKGRR